MSVRTRSDAADARGDASGRCVVVFVVPGMGLGGAEHQLLTVLEGLDRTRFEPVLVTLDYTGPLFDRVAAAGVRAEWVGAEARGVLARISAVARVLRETGASVVVTRGFSADTIGRLAARRAGVPGQVVAEHASGETGRRFWHGAVDAALAGRTSAWVAVTEAQRPRLEGARHADRSRVTVVANGIPAEHTALDRAAARERLGLGADSFVVGCVATLRPEKAVPMLVSACSRALGAVPELALCIIGDGPSADDVRAAVDARDLRKRTVLAGAVHDAAELLAAFDVFALPSRSEALPLALLEAMRAGCAIVATRVGGVPEALGDSGVLVDAGDDAALADAIEGLARDVEGREALGESARRRFHDRYTDRSMVAAYEELLERVSTGERP